jgi:hypothetical protein
VAERPLPGGFVNRVVRVGGTVRRRPERVRPPAAPPLRAAPVAGRAEGAGPRRAGPGGADLAARSRRLALADRPGGLDREPGASRSTGPPVPRPDRGHGVAGDQEVFCPNDLAPRNTVHRDRGAGLRPVAFLDRDASTTWPTGVGSTWTSGRPIADRPPSQPDTTSLSSTVDSCWGNGRPSVISHRGGDVGLTGCARGRAGPNRSVGYRGSLLLCRANGWCERTGVLRRSGDG